MTKAFVLLMWLTHSLLYSGEVTMFSPEGNVKNIQQVTARFSTDMTPLGDPRDTILPFTPSCLDQAGKTQKLPASTSRWADTKNWVMDFTSPIEAGIRCRMSLKPGLKDFAGNIVPFREYEFSTSGPAITQHYPSYESIEPDQYFILVLDGEVDEDSVLKNTYFEVEGLSDKIKVKIIKGRDRVELVKNKFNNDSDYKSNLENFNKKVLVLAAQRRFPENARVVYHWTTGVKSLSGLAVTESKTLNFTSISPFVAEFTCERTTNDGGCNPIGEMSVFFNRSLDWKDLEKASFKSNNNQSWIAEEIKQKSKKSKNEDDKINRLTFKGPFPEKSKFTITLPSSLKDDLDRPLTNQKAFPLDIRTEEYSPLIKFSGRFGVVEYTQESMLPVSVRNVEDGLLLGINETEGKSFNLNSFNQIKEVINLYKKVAEKDDYPTLENDQRNIALLEHKKSKSFTLPKPNGARAFEMMGIPLKTPGFYVVEVKSPKLGNALTISKNPMYVSTSALVTNLGVHFKKGAESSLVWVTRLNDSKPVQEAQISIRDCEGNELAKGVTDINGILKVGIIPQIKKSGKAVCSEYAGMFVFAKKGDDFSFMSTQWSQGIETWRFQVSREYEDKTWGRLIAHSIMDRTLFKPGETLKMKHVLREHHQNGFSIASKKLWPKRIYIRHSGSGKVYDLPVNIDVKTGTGVNDFVLTKEMPLGSYAIFFSNADKKKKIKSADETSESEYDWNSLNTGSFLLSNFRLPMMAATVKIQGENLVRAKEVKVDLSAHYLSGGPASKLKIISRYQLEPTYFIPDFSGSDEYSFFAKPIKPGLFDRGITDVKFDEMKISPMTLDNHGGALLNVMGLETSHHPKNLVVEMEYTDPNGEVKTSSGSKTIYPSNTIIGLKLDSWFGSNKATKVLGVVTNPESKLLGGKKFTIEAYKREYFTHRKRLVGGFYSYDSKTEITALGKVCTGVTAPDGRFECTIKGLPAGSIDLQASVEDENNYVSYATVSATVFEDGVDQWWTPGDSDRIDILGQKKSYEPGDIAEYIVKTPFKESTALVTIEREGILDQYVMTINRDNPVIKFPIKSKYAPNVFVSAILVRGRVGEPKPDFLVDLGKPAIKMGLAEVKVGWSGHKLRVEVTTDQKNYKVKDTAEVRIKVTSPDGKALPANSEVVLAAVDESLLQLKSNSSYDLLSAMMKQRSLSVEASSNLNQVIGRRHFGLKAKAPGGGGGGASADDKRDNFDPLLAFIPNLKLDAEGVVVAKIKLNDSISSFRIVAIAYAGAELFGMNKVNITTNKDLILYSGIAPVARDGDQIQHAFSVRNTTDKKMSVEISAKAEGLPNFKSHFPLIELNPSETKLLSLPVSVPKGVKEIKFQLSAIDKFSKASDDITVKSVVSDSVPTRVLQATLLQLEKSNVTPVKRPDDAIAGSGSINVSAKASLVQGLSGVRDYMERYPYSCLEQRISKSIVLEDIAEMKKIIQNLPSFIDNDGLLKFFDTQGTCGSSQLTHYFLDILQENNIALPEKIQGDLLKGINNALSGRFTCHPYWASSYKSNVSDQRRILLIQTLSRYKKFKPQLLDSINVTPNAWSTETLVNWIQLLRRESSISKRDQQLLAAENILKARVNFQGSVMNLQSSKNTDHWQLFTSADQEALGVFGLTIDQDKTGADAARLARGLTSRLKLGHWDTTMANAWGVTMMKKFSAKFEKTKISGNTSVSINESKEAINWAKKPAGEKVIMSWPSNAAKSIGQLKIEHVGNGKPWVHIETTAAIPLTSPMNFGYSITKKLSPVVQKNKGKWSVGDVIDVELKIMAQSDQAWVVLQDPIPSGAAHLGTGMSGESELLNRPKNQTNDEDNYWPSEYDEKSFSNFITYAGYLTKGAYKINYRYRVNSAGTFKLPPTHVEAMYSPEVFGDTPNEDLVVVP